MEDDPRTERRFDSGGLGDGGFFRPRATPSIGSLARAWETAGNGHSAAGTVGDVDLATDEICAVLHHTDTDAGLLASTLGLQAGAIVADFQLTLSGTRTLE